MDVEPNDLKDFLSWVFNDDQGHPLLTVRASEGKGLGVFLASAVQGPLVLTTLSPSKVLSKSKVLDISCHPSASASSERLRKCLDCMRAKGIEDERRIIMSFLLLGNLLKSQPVSTSELTPEYWIPYFKVLPRCFCTPVFFRGQESRWLVGTGLDISRRSKLGTLREEYDELLDCFELLYHQEKDLITFEDYKRADATFWSRVLSFKDVPKPSSNPFALSHDDLHLVPFLDFFNHSIFPEVYWNFDYDLTILLKKSERLIEPGELCISYGQKPNAELLFIHGFVLENNPYDNIGLMIPFVESQQVPMSSENQALLEAKSHFVLSHAIGPIVKIKMPDLDAAEEDERHVLESDISMLYLAAIVSEDGLEAREGKLLFKGKVIPSPEYLVELVESLPHFDVIRLRVTTILMDAVHHRKTILLDSASEMDEEPQMGEPETKLSMVSVLKNGHLDILESVLAVLENLTNEYANRPLVQKYLTEC
jgi:hypothetical protein